ncbi:hypothetical protein P389DRAFT_65582 [Cystobasidium minutum MCA 4210]|uniref:uncharacterized protein n=1 Tax=Cystobasidium minutum MCA 4210 TaxID=1397322 RepID=UPI0034CE2818|eukprot:jgi/Rhomi1/65582/CE65581_1567
MTDPLSPEKLLEIIKSTVLSGGASSSSGTSTSTSEAEQSTSDNNDDNSGNASSITLANTTSLIALLVHSIHTSLGFRQTRPAPPNIDSEGSTSQDPLVRNKVRQDWFDGKSEEESFSFEYRHEQSSLVFQVRIARLGGRTVVNAVAVEDDKTATLDIVTNDYTSSSNFPKALSSITSLSELFNSPTRLNDLIKAYKVQVIQKLLPGLVKPGYNEENTTSARDGGNSGGNAPPPSAGPSQPRPDLGGEGDGRIGTPPNFLRPPGYGQNPLEIGRSDLDPLGGQVGRLPGAGGDGMLVGPNHPLFNRERSQENPLGGGAGQAGQRGPWGGDGFLPPLGAPPGARFDPITPFGIGGNVPNQPPRRNWGDEFPPPGFDNELDADPQRGFNPLNPGGGLGGLGGPRGGFGPGSGRGGFGGMPGGGNMFM